MQCSGPLHFQLLRKAYRTRQPSLLRSRSCPVPIKTIVIICIGSHKLLWWVYFRFFWVQLLNLAIGKEQTENACVLRLDRGAGNFYIMPVSNKWVARVNLACDENLKADYGPLALWDFGFFSLFFRTDLISIMSMNFRCGKFLKNICIFFGIWFPDILTWISLSWGAPKNPQTLWEKNCRIVLLQANEKQQGVSITWSKRGLQKAPLPEITWSFYDGFIYHISTPFFLRSPND